MLSAMAAEPGRVFTRKLTEAQGGTVSVASTPGHGSVFTERLPQRATVR
ncbi:hypothetical protein V1460_18510 [Streptomyces sp. SCSIO 30461]